MFVFHSKEQWQGCFRNEGQFFLNNTRHTTKGVLKIYGCTYAKKAGWHQCPNQLRVKFLERGGVVQSWNGEDHYHQKNLVSQSGTFEGCMGTEWYKGKDP